MITITLKELNNSFQSLNGVAESLTAGKMKYRFAKVLKKAEGEIDELGSALADLAAKHGAQLIGGNRFQFNDSQKDELIKFNNEADSLLRTDTVAFDFDPKFFTFDELAKAEDSKKPINASQLADLLWLISDADE